MGEERPDGRGGPGVDPSGVPGPRRTSAAAGDENGVMADSVAVHSKWDRTECAGMVRYPLPGIWPISPRPPSLLRRL